MNTLYYGDDLKIWRDSFNDELMILPNDSLDP